MRGASGARLLLGLLLVLAGGLFLLDTTGTIDTDNVWGLIWPLFLVFLGGSWLARERGRSLVGLVVLTLGIGFFAQNAGWIEGGWIGRWWPLLLIVVGVAILVDAVGFLRPKRLAATTSEGGPETSLVAVMGGRKARVTSGGWKGGRATALMGGIELDLRDATLDEEGAVLDVTAVMGGVEVQVPQGWGVDIDATPLLGAFEDKTRGAPEGGPRLLVTGVAIMGGVEIKD